MICAMRASGTWDVTPIFFGRRSPVHEYARPGLGCTSGGGLAAPALPLWVREGAGPTGNARARLGCTSGSGLAAPALPLWVREGAGPTGNARARRGCTSGGGLAAPALPLWVREGAVATRERRARGTSEPRAPPSPCLSLLLTPKHKLQVFTADAPVRAHARAHVQGPQGARGAVCPFLDCLNAAQACTRARAPNAIAWASAIYGSRARTVSIII